jgi:hypothetical protein
MKNENVVSKLDRLLREIDKIEAEHPFGLTEEADRRIDELMCECVETTKEMNTIYRAMLRDSPEKMAEWKAVTSGFDQRCNDYLKFLDDPESKKKTS